MEKRQANLAAIRHGIRHGIRRGECNPGLNIPPDKWPLYMDGVFKTNRAIRAGATQQVLGFRSHLHLISHGWFFGGANATLGMIDEIRLAHFLRHYLETLGVMPGNMHLFVRLAPTWRCLACAARDRRESHRE